MRTFSEYNADDELKFKTAIANARDRIARCQSEETAKRTDSASLQEDISSAEAERQALVGKQNVIARDLQSLKEKLESLSREMRLKQSQLEEHSKVVDSHDADIRRRRDRARQLATEIESISKQSTNLTSDLNQVISEEKKARLHNYSNYLGELFETMRQFSADSSIREKWRLKREAYDTARGSDRSLADAHDERLELMRLIKSTELPSLRDKLSAELRRIESVILEKHPGIFESPPDNEPPELAEIHYHYDSESDTTYMFLPLLDQFWSNPPVHASDPRGSVFCKIIWSFVQPFAEILTSIDLVAGCIVMEFAGDRVAQVGAATVSVDLGGGKVVDFYLEPMPAHLVEAFQSTGFSDADSSTPAALRVSSFEPAAPDYISFIDLAVAVGVPPMLGLVELCLMNQPWNDCWPHCHRMFIDTIISQRRVRQGMPPVDVVCPQEAKSTAQKVGLSLPVSEKAAAILNKLLIKNYGARNISVRTLVNNWVHGAKMEDVEELIERGNLDWSDAKRTQVHLVPDHYGDSNSIVNVYRTICDGRRV